MVTFVTYIRHRGDSICEAITEISIRIKVTLVGVMLLRWLARCS